MQPVQWLPDFCTNCANRFVISSDVSMNRSTQFVKHDSVLLSNLLLGVSMHLSQQISLNSCICGEKENKIIIHSPIVSYEQWLWGYMCCTETFGKTSNSITYLGIDLSLLFFHHQKLLEFSVATRFTWIEISHFSLFVSEMKSTEKTHNVCDLIWMLK